MWGVNVWGQPVWGSEPATYTGHGGLLVAGGVGSFPVDLSFYCPCDIDALPVGPGGLVLGGSALYSDTIIGPGGLLLGGRAVVDLVGDLSDGYVGWWLLTEAGNGTAGEYHDLSRFGLHGQGGGGKAAATPTLDTSTCRSLQLFSGKQYILLPAETVNPPSFTISAWYKPETFFVPRTIFSRGWDTPDGKHWSVQVGHDYLNHPFASVNLWNDAGDAQEFHVTGPTQLERAKLYYLAFVYEAGHMSVYVNGVLDKEKDIDALPFLPIENGMYIGRFNSGQLPTGYITDVRFYSDVRDADWLLAEYESQCNPFFSIVGTEETV